MRLELSNEIKEFSAAFTKAGYSLYLVGGAVRDMLLRKENHDYDFTTDAEPEEVRKLFRRTIATGIKHGTVTVIFKGRHYEVTTFRTESDYKDSRHPESVKFVRNIEEDLKRRDFTINAMALSIPGGELKDLHGGRADLKKKIIRAIGNPEERFEEDALRMMRACRFSAQLGFRIEKLTLQAMKENAERIANVSAERIKEEFFRIIASDDPARGIEAMREAGLMEHILPELSRCIGFELGGMHSEDLYQHLVLALSFSAAHGYPMSVRLASLFHDLGKFDTRRDGIERKYTFYGHDEISASIADRIMRRMKCSNEEREGVVHLVRNHMFSYTPDWTDSAVRRFIRRIGLDWINPLFELRIADMNATIGARADISSLEVFAERIEAELSKENALSIKDLAIDGKMLIEAGIKAGPEMGRILSTLLDEVIENPSLNRRDLLLERALTLSQAQGR